MTQKINRKKIDRHLHGLFQAAKAAEEESRNGSRSKVCDNLTIVIDQARAILTYFDFKEEATDMSSDNDLMAIRRKALAALWEWRRSNGSRLVMLEHLSQIQRRAQNALAELGSVI